MFRKMGSPTIGFVFICPFAMRFAWNMVLHIFLVPSSTNCGGASFWIKWFIFLLLRRLLYAVQSCSNSRRYLYRPIAPATPVCELVSRSWHERARNWTRVYHCKAGRWSYTISQDDDEYAKIIHSKIKQNSYI